MGRQTLRGRAPGTVKPQALSALRDRAPCPRPRQPGAAALDKAWTVLGDTAWGGGAAWRVGPVEPWGGDAGCRVGVRGTEGPPWDSLGGGTRRCPGLAWRWRKQVSFCKTGGAVGAAESQSGGSGRSTQRACWRQSPRQCHGDTS